jgi:polysaccharide chain length determinant protein (PEP-CTERM system associated)
MHDVMAQVLFYARGIWLHRWYAVLIAWCISIAGWIAVLKMPDQFQASARVFIDTQSLLSPALGGLALDTSGIQRQQLALMTQTLLSRPNLEKLVRMADLDLRAKGPEEMEFLLNSLTNQIGISADRGQPNLYNIHYTNNDPQIAQRVVDTLLTIFKESALSSQRQDTQNTQRFLDEQIKQYQDKLVASEKKLEDFKRKNAAFMPGEGGNYYSRLQTAVAQMDQAQLELLEVKNRKDELLRQLQGEEPGVFDLPEQKDSRFAAIDARIQALQLKMDELLLGYTKNHPDVLAIKATIKALENEKRKQMEALKSTPASAYSSSNLMQQQLQLALGEAEANIAALQVRVQEYEKRVNELKSMVDTLPKIEAGLANLNRDYEVLKQNYNSLLQRREAAKLAEEAEQSTHALQLKVIDPPRVPLAPVGPNRPLYLTLVLLGAFGGGVAFALFLALTKPTFDDRQVLAEITGLPVYGVVSMVWTSRQKLRNRLEITGFALASLLLVVSYGAILARSILLGQGVGS